jgi:hypothetical protein
MEKAGMDSGSRMDVPVLRLENDDLHACTGICTSLERDGNGKYL